MAGEVLDMMLTNVSAPFFPPALEIATLGLTTSVVLVVGLTTGASDVCAHCAFEQAGWGAGMAGEVLDMMLVNISAPFFFTSNTPFLLETFH
jgi:hypothetical protein